MKFFLKNQGVVTAFVTMIMVPVVVFTGTFVDISRFKFCSSQAIMAADAYAEGVLSVFNNRLKQLYGLYSISTHDDGKALIEKMDDYAKYSFNPAADPQWGEKNVTGHMPYALTDVEIMHKNVEGATLSNSNVLLTQVADFMQYRIVGEVIKDGKILEALEGMEKVSADSEAVDVFSDMADSSTEVLEEIQKYYELLRDIDKYPSYKETRENNFLLYGNALTEISESEDYAKYINYKNNKQSIDEAKEYIEDYIEREEEAAENGEEFEEELDEDKEKLAEEWVDEAAYLSRIGAELTLAQEIAHDVEGSPIDFDNTEKKIKDLGKKAEDIQKKIGELCDYVEKLRDKLPECSEKLRQGIEEDIAGIEQITNMAESFLATYNLINDNGNITKNENNKENYGIEREPLDEVKDKILEGTLPPGTKDWNTSIELEWYDFKDNSDANTFYTELKDVCKSVSGEGGDEKAGKKETDRADGYTKEAMDSINNDNDDNSNELRDIGSLAGELRLDGGSSQGNEIGVVGTFNIGQGITNVIDKFLLASYNFGMFSSRVTGIEKKEDGETGGTPAGGSSEEYEDYSLTKIKMSPKVNYLYKAELEYLFGGKTTSKENWNITRNVICSVRMAFNFASTYAIRSVHDAINGVAKAAETAVAATGVGAPAAVLVRIAVSGALRAAVAGMETAAEWKQLKNRESVMLYKKNVDDLEIIDKIEDIIGESVAKGGGRSSGIKLSYEDYLYLLMIIFINTETLTDRTANLITLNVNQSANSGDTLSSLDFKMSETVTAIESVCKVKMDFIVVPENFANMFISGTEIETKVQALEDRYTGFSLIRGY